MSDEGFLVFFASLFVRHTVQNLQPGLDLATEGVLEVLNHARERHVLEVLLEAKLLPLVHVLWLDVELLVFLHKTLAFPTECAAVFFEVAAELNQVKDGNEIAPAEPDEIVHEFAHHRLPLLSRVALTPLFTRTIFVIRLTFLFLPKHV